MGVKIIPQLTDDAAKGMVDVAKYLLEGKNFGQNARLGWVRLIGSKGAQFTILDQAYFQAPELYMFSPVDVVASEVKKTDKSSEFPMDFKISLENRTPLQIELGKIRIAVKSGNNTVLDIQNKGGPVTLLNARQVKALKATSNPANATFRASVELFNMDYQLILQDVMQFLNPFKYKIDFAILDRDNQRLKWLDTLSQKLMTPENLLALAPSVLVFAQTLRIKLYGLTLNKNPKLTPTVTNPERFLKQFDSFYGSYGTITTNITQKELLASEWENLFKL
jgi:hypothetical protein